MAPALLLAVCCLRSDGATPSVTLAWDRNSEPDVSGYTIYFGFSSGQYTSWTNVGNVTTNVVSGLAPGSNYFFTVTAYNTSGLESEPSNEISYLVPTNGPSGFVGVPTEVTINKNNSAVVPFTIGGISGSNIGVRVVSSRPTLLPIRSTTLQGAGTNRSLVLAPVRDRSGRATITLSLTQGIEVVSHAIAVTVTASNNAPTMTTPPALSGWKQKTLPLTGLQARDVDVTGASTANFRLILTANHGVIKLRTTIAGGVTAVQVRGNGTRRVVITAPLRAINRTLAARAGVCYRGNLNFVGADAITGVLSDRGNTGAGGAKTCTVSAVASIAGDAYDVWRNDTFAEADLRLATRERAVWGDNADPDFDGRDNLMEFALGSDPYVKDASTNGLVSSLTQTNGAAYLSLDVMRRLAQDVVAYLPEVSADGHDWNSAGVELLQTAPVNGSLETATLRDTTAAMPGQLRLMRLRVARGQRGSTSDVFVATACLLPGATTSREVITPVPVPFVLPSDYQGQVTAVNSNRVVDFAAGWSPNVFGSRPFGVELDSGETIRILSNDLNTIVLEHAPNALPTVGERFRIRPLLTVEEMFESAVSPGADADTADNVLLFDAASQQTRTVFLATNVPPGWRDRDGVDGSQAIVPARCSTLVRRRTAGDRTLVAHGVVGRAPGLVTIHPGLNWIAAPPTGDPLTLGQLRLFTGSSATGMAGGTSDAIADTLTVFSHSGAWTSYFYCTMPSEAGWRDIFLAPATNGIRAGTAILVERKLPRSRFVWRMPLP